MELKPQDDTALVDPTCSDLIRFVTVVGDGEVEIRSCHNDSELRLPISDIPHLQTALSNLHQ